jgi:hypothetical protein
MVVATAGFLISSTLFLAQGGFGGGHGRFDFALSLLVCRGFLSLNDYPNQSGQSATIFHWFCCHSC